VSARKAEQCRLSDRATHAQTDAQVKNIVPTADHGTGSAGVQMTKELGTETDLLRSRADSATCVAPRRHRCYSWTSVVVVVVVAWTTPLLFVDECCCRCCCRCCAVAVVNSADMDSTSDGAAVELSGGVAA